MAERRLHEAESDEYNTDDDGSKQPSSKRPKKARGAAVYHTKFNKDWTSTWPFIRDVQGDIYSFLCTICKKQVSCKHQGRRDVERHIEKSLHQANAKAAKSQTSLPFQPMSSALADKVYYSILLV